jgi:hypothetical protein
MSIVGSPMRLVLAAWPPLSSGVALLCTSYRLQERLWKRVAAKSIAFAAAAARRARSLKAVPPPVAKCGDKLGKVRWLPEHLAVWTLEPPELAVQHRCCWPPVLPLPADTCCQL